MLKLKKAGNSSPVMVQKDSSLVDVMKAPLNYGGPFQLE